MALIRRTPKLKRLSDQTIVITGASSGIGLATARMAAARGARVVLTSRNADDLRRETEEIRRRGGRATFVVADVADPEAMDRVADVAQREFGALDTWVNNAGVSIYGKLTDVPLEDKKRLFDTNFWGVVNGCRTAVRHSGRAAAPSSTSAASRRIAPCRCSGCIPRRSTPCRGTPTRFAWSWSTTAFPSP